MQTKIIIHGGFFSESSTSAEVKKLKQDALQRIATNAYNYLQAHTATETVVYAVELLENDALFNAGLGSQIQSDGKIRMSASIMDGETQKFSGVINIQNIQNPIQVAQKLLSYDDRVLGGEGANEFATANNFPAYNVELPQRRTEYLQKLKSKGLGTVGCVALDASGKLAAATSTGGKGFEMVGRISDSATIAGNYANAHCGVSCTGVGEDIVSGAVAAKIVIRVTDGFTIKDAFQKTFAELTPYDGFAGAIGIDAHGNIYNQDSHPSMVYASFDGTAMQVFN
ncbi:MAG: isoaspartyl peptidase/L-asparaginase [Bacteroidia bacterium]|nr:isoaspartyl peptidase/L-asparaginase [Bacteroidia bacterium]